MADADPCRRVLTPAEEARLFARDAVRAARASWSRPADEGAAMIAVFVVLAAEAMFPELLSEPETDGAGKA